jgi:restriction system protein
MTKTWMIRAMEGGRLFEKFKDRSVVAVGWGDIGSLEQLTSREDIAAKISEIWPEWSAGKVSMSSWSTFPLSKRDGSE